MTVGRALAKNSVLNFAGLLAPLLAAIVATPILLRGIGEARYGLLLIVWTAIGYFSLFDLGLGRALTHALSVRRETSSETELAQISWGTLALMVIFGVVTGAVLATATPLLVHRVLTIDPSLQRESIQAFYLLAVTLPVTLLTSGLRGLLEAHQEFGLATAIRLPLGVFNFVAPLLVLPYSHSLVPIVAVLVVGRFVGGIAHLVACLRRYPFLRRRVPFDWTAIAPLLRTGGWMTVSNIISPLMVTFDRFVVGGMLGVAAVAYYATPYELVTKLLIVPSALLTVLFPEFAARFIQDRARTALLVERALRVVILAVFPATLIIVAFAFEGLRLWLGAPFAIASAPVLRWLAAGVLLNAVGHVFFVALQGVGRPDLTAKLHLLELPAYAASMWMLAHTLGLVGFAVAWTLRVGVDAFCLGVLVVRRFPESRREISASLWRMLFALAVLALAALPTSPAARTLTLVAALVGYALYARARLLLPAERRMLGAWLAGAS
jgi:O-antigen/teichoic acid export membrane protein